MLTCDGGCVWLVLFGVGGREEYGEIEDTQRCVEALLLDSRSDVDSCGRSISCMEPMGRA